MLLLAPFGRSAAITTAELRCKEDRHRIDKPSDSLNDKDEIMTMITTMVTMVRAVSGKGFSILAKTEQFLVRSLVESYI